MNPARNRVPKIRKIQPASPRRSDVVPAMHHASAPAPTSQTTERNVDPAHATPIWHVWLEGGEPVGPVSADQIARGIRAGKIASDASIRRDDDPFWSDLLDIPEIVLALKAVTVESEAPPASSLTPNLTAARYLVWVDGSEPVGPVSADQIARGIRAGKVPSHASLQREGDFFATDVLDEPEVIAALKQL